MIGLIKAINFINENKIVEVEVNLHLHYDKDEDFDYTGLHSIGINVWRNEKQCQCFEIDLDGYNEDACRNEQAKIIKKIKSISNVVNHREFIHD